MYILKCTFCLLGVRRGCPCCEACACNLEFSIQLYRDVHVYLLLILQLHTKTTYIFLSPIATFTACHRILAKHNISHTYSFIAHMFMHVIYNVYLVKLKSMLFVLYDTDSNFYLK